MVDVAARGGPSLGIVFEGATLVDKGGARRGDLRVADGVITHVGRVSPEKGDEIIDVQGKFVTPGLIDCHVHFTIDAGTDLVGYTRRAESELAIRAAGFARQTLLGGVTTVRDLGGVGTIAQRLRDLIRGNVIPGPRMLVAGQVLTVTGGHGHFMGVEADGPVAFRRAARDQLKKGADWLKVMATGGVMTAGVDPRSSQPTAAELGAVVDVAARAGRKVAAHAHGGEGILNAVEAGVASIEHGTLMDAPVAKELARKKTYWVPTRLAVERLTSADAVRAGVPSFAIEKAKSLEAAHREAFGHALRNKVRIAMGTDAGVPLGYHGTNARELGLMVDAGLSPKAAIQAATSDAADLLGLSKEVGALRVGFAADLLVLGRNPIEFPDAFVASLEDVVKGGRFVKRNGQPLV